MTKNKSVFLGIAFFIAINQQVYAWDPEVTHTRITELAINQFVLSAAHGDYLRNLGFTDGLLSIIKWNDEQQKINQWMSDVGAQYEDGNNREVNHFHDPLKPWSNAGLWGIWDSAVVWAQDSASQASWPYGASQPPIDVCQAMGICVQTPTLSDWSWQTTRGYYYAALTSTTDTARQANFAKTFVGVGHQMHLLQDMSVPMHVRNDSHLFNRWIEEWVANHGDIFNSLSAISIPNVSFNNTTDTLAPVPVAHLFDSNIYDGTNPSDTMNSDIGLSEYTNANFVSAGTIDSGEFPYPIVSDDPSSSVIKVTKDIHDPHDPTNDPTKTVKRDYYWKQRHGDSGYLLTGVGAIRYYANSNQMPWEPTAVDYPMDDLVHTDYANHLLPRAVGYSTGLLNYFFRGSIEITLPDNGVYAITGPDPNGSFTRIHLNAQNTTTGERMTNGTIQLVVKYKKAQADPIPFGDVPVDDEFSYIVVPEKNNITALSSKDQGETPVELVFDLDPSLSLWTTDLYLQVVYRGQLGNEIDAVAVGFKDISEPTPVDVVNNMDYACFDGVYLKAGSDEALAIARNSDYWVDVYPHGLQNVYLAFSPKQSPQNASPANYSALFGSIPSGSYGRVFVLTDYEFKVSTTETEVKEDTRDTLSMTYHQFLSGIYDAEGRKNQTDWVNGEEVRISRKMLMLRGVYAWTVISYATHWYTIQNGQIVTHCDITSLQAPLTGLVGVEIVQ